MRYSYDLNNPIERKMFIDKKRREYERIQNKELSFHDIYCQILKERQEEFEYFRNKEEQERIQEEQINKQIEEQLSKSLDKALDKALKEIFK